MVRQCLIDADVLCYEIGFAAETAWKHASPNSEDRPPWVKVEELLLQRIDHIEQACEATLPSIFYFTGNGNFRNDVAKRHPYKLRPGNKPFHYANIKAYIQGVFEFRVQDGLEADDLMSIEQTVRGDETIICTRDKDLRSVDGWHFGWELGKQPAFGPQRVDDYGTIFLNPKRTEVKGWGLKFFLAQCLTGDSTDTIPGLPGCGAVGAFELLENTKTYLEGYEAVGAAYRGKYELLWLRELTEQAQLLWMVRALNEDGSPVMWDFARDYGAN